MNLEKLFKAQKELDDRIVEEKGLQRKVLLDKKILALQVELGELANELRGFKFWSEDQKPRTNEPIECETCDGWGSETDPYGICMSSDKCENCSGTGFVGSRNPLLEEYVDCLHFILSIGNELNIEQWDYDYTFKDDLMELNNITEQFIMIMGGARKLFYDIAYRDGMKDDEKVSEFELEFRVWKSYRLIIGPFLSLGKMLGFTGEQIEQA